nr:DUF4157 domain-containing protein [Polyangium fumosum]
MREGGSPLEPGTRSRMESRFGVDLGAVRIHEGARAAEAADRLDARAFTLGRNIVLGDGEPALGSPAGEGLLAHELAHTIQQGFAASIPAAPRISRASSSEERAADAAARSTTRGARPALATTPVQIAREAKGDKPAERVEIGPPVADPWKGVLVSSVIISLARGKCGFVTDHGVLIGEVSTDLPVGVYELTPVPETGTWNISGKDVKEGSRFDIDFSKSGADPWTLRYPNKVPLTVSAGSLAEPADVSAHLAQGGELDPLWAFDGPQPPPPAKVTGIDDFETVSLAGGSPPLYRIEYRDRPDELRTYADLTPKMRKRLQSYFDANNEGFSDFVVGTFPLWWGFVSGAPLFTGLPQVGGARPYIPGRVSFAKPPQGQPPPGGAPVVTVPPVNTPPGPKPSRIPLQRPAAGRPPEPMTQSPPQEQAGAQPQGATATAAASPVVSVSALQTPQGPGVQFGKDAAARLKAQGITGGGILHPMATELNAQPNMAPMDKATAMQVACNAQTAFGAGPIVRMPNDVIVVTSRAPLQNAPVVLVHPNGTVGFGRANIRLDKKTLTYYVWDVTPK